MFGHAGDELFASVYPASLRAFRNGDPSLGDFGGGMGRAQWKADDGGDRHIRTGQ